MMLGTVQLSFGVVPQFGLLYDILVYGEQQHLLFIFSSFKTIKYDAILGAYEVVSLPHYQCLHRSSIQCYHLFNAVQHGDSTSKFIKSKYDLTVYCNYP